MTKTCEQQRKRKNSVPAETRQVPSLPYFEAFASLYSNFSSLGMWGDPKKLFHHLFNKHAMPANNQYDVLDVGIGSGESARPFIDSGCAVTGIDGAANMLDQCTKKLSIPSTQLYLVDIATQEFPLPDESFDIVISNQTLYFIENPKNALNEMARVLRPGGTLIFNYQQAKQENIETITNDITGYDGTTHKSTVQTYQHSSTLMDEFIRANGLIRQEEPITYTGYRKLRGAEVEFTLSMLQKPVR